jgi:hypothetical protein
LVALISARAENHTHTCAFLEHCQVSAADERLKQAEDLKANIRVDKEKIDAEILESQRRVGILEASIQQKKAVLPQLDETESLARKAVAWVTETSRGLMIPTKDNVSNFFDRYYGELKHAGNFQGGMGINI